MTTQAFSVALNLLDGYRFRADFGLDGVPSLDLDEPPPLGAGQGPNPARLLAAAVGNCLAASLLYCLRRARVDVLSMDTRIEGTMVRNERGRLRIGGLSVKLEPHVPPEQHERMTRCLELFEDFCVVTESVRRGLDVAVEVQPVEPASLTTGLSAAVPTAGR